MFQGQKLKRWDLWIVNYHRTFYVCCWPSHTASVSLLPQTCDGFFVTWTFTLLWLFKVVFNWLCMQLSSNKFVFNTEITFSAHYVFLQIPIRKRCKAVLDAKTRFFRLPTHFIKFSFWLFSKIVHCNSRSPSSHRLCLCTCFFVENYGKEWKAKNSMVVSCMRVYYYDIC